MGGFSTTSTVIVSIILLVATPCVLGVFSTPGTTTGVAHQTTPMSIPVSGAPNQDLPKYFGTTNDLSLQTTPGVVYGGLTKEIKLTCSLSRATDSDFGDLLALILYKIEETGHKPYRELAALSSLTDDPLHVKLSLGADVTGQMTSNADSALTFKWAWPGKDVEGVYYCEAHGSGSNGFPRISTASVKVNSNTLDKSILNTIEDMETHLSNCSSERITNEERHQEELNKTSSEKEKLLERVHTLEGQLVEVRTEHELQSQTIKRLKASEEELKRQLKESSVLTTYGKAAALESYFVSGRGHTYFLSPILPVDVDAYLEVCHHLDGYLLEIDDDDELDYVVNLIQRLKKEIDIKTGQPGLGVVVGGWDKGHEGHWTYIRTENPMTSLNWNTGEPNDHGNGEDCMTLSEDSKMNDIPCIEHIVSKRFMCEIP